MKIFYKTRATASGGRSGSTALDDGSLAIELADPFLLPRLPHKIRQPLERDAGRRRQLRVRFRRHADQRNLLQIRPVIARWLQAQ